MSNCNKKFYCKHCNVGFQHESKYNRHCLTQKHIKNSNTNDKIAPCPNLKPKKTYTCSTCNYTTDSNYKYKRHCLSKKHIKNSNQDTDLNQKKTYTCVKCNYITYRKSDYTRHCKTKKHIEKSSELIIYNKYKKQSISKSTKKASWEMHSNRQYDIKCCCCNYEYINPNSCSYGHIVSEYNGGSIKLYNIIPICYNCNSSMGKVNMHVFMLKNGYMGSALLHCSRMYMDMIHNKKTNDNICNKFMIEMNDDYTSKLVECYNKHCSNDEYFEMMRNSTPEYKSEIRRIIQERSTTINL